jgi:hypothetical protein
MIRVRLQPRRVEGEKPGDPSASNRFNHLRAVRGQTPAARAVASGICPLRIARTIRSRPRGVSRAFLCTFIRFSENRSSVDDFSFLGSGWMDNLIKPHN